MIKNLFTYSFNILSDIIYFLIVFIIIYIIIYTIMEYRQKYLKSHKKIDKFYYILKKTISSLSKFTSIIIIAFSLLFLLSIVDGIGSYVEEIKEINKLKTYIKNLSTERKITDFKILSTDNNYITVQITNYSVDGLEASKNIYQIEGTEIYLDFLVLNFEYKIIESNQSNNIAIINKLYSDYVPYDNGIDLFEKEILQFKKSDPVGLTNKDFSSFNNYIEQIILDKNFAKKEGVRSYHGSSLHVNASTGDEYRVYIQNTGGLTLKKINF